MKVYFSHVQTHFKGINLTHKNLSQFDLWDLCKSDCESRTYFLEGRFNINQYTAQIEKAILIKTLVSIYKIKAFKKLEFEGHYSEGTAEEIFTEVKKLAAED